MLFPTFPKILAGAVLPSLLLFILPWSSYVYASSEEHQTRQGDAETGITWPIPGLQNDVSPGMGAGMASLFMATLANQRAEGFCAKEQDGTRNSLEGCITANVAGVIFGVYGIYRIGGGFVTTRDNPPVLLLGSSAKLAKWLSIQPTHLLAKVKGEKKRTLLYLIWTLSQEILSWITLLMATVISYYMEKIIREYLT